MTTEKLWAVKTNTDLTEGQGREFVKFWCSKKATALRLGKRGYVQGSDCPISEIEVFVFEGRRFLPVNQILIEAPSADDLKMQELLDKRAEAIAKAKAAGLSDEDITLLKGGAT